MYVANQNTAIFKQNHQVRLLVLAFTTIYSIFLSLFVLFAYGRFPVWPVLEGGWNFSLLNLSLDVIVWDILIQKCPTKIHDVSFCRSLEGNQIEELPAGVFSNNNELLNLWVGRLKVHSRPTYFYCHILLQILVNSKILKYYRTRLMSPATIVLREEPYLLVHFLEYHNIYLSATGEGSTAWIGIFRKPRLRWQRGRGKKEKM